MVGTMQTYNRSEKTKYCACGEEKVYKIIDIAVPGDSRLPEEDREKVEVYQELKREIARIWSTRKVEVIPIVVGVLVTITK